MSKAIMVGCDLHDKTMVLSLARGADGKVERKTFANAPKGRQLMRTWLQEISVSAGTARIVFAYEASCLGFGLYDELRDHGIEAHVIAPTRIARSVSDRRNKHDQRDADQLLDIVRGHVLAGNSLHSVWVPSLELRDDREIVRTRLEVTVKVSRIKVQIKSLLKRNGIEIPAGKAKGGKSYRTWLNGQADDKQRGTGLRMALSSLLRQQKQLEEEVQLLEDAVGQLSLAPRYHAAVQSLCMEHGVGVLTAMVFVTELGCARRFQNRQQVAAYFGLTPTSQESGEKSNRKGHITRQGSGRMRKLLCQSMWVRLRFDAEEKARYEKLVALHPKHKKVAVVAGMRRLVIRMWHHVGDSGDGSLTERMAQRAKSLSLQKTTAAPGRRKA